MRAVLLLIVLAGAAGLCGLAWWLVPGGRPGRGVRALEGSAAEEVSEPSLPAQPGFEPAGRVVQGGTTLLPPERDELEREPRLDSRERKPDPFGSPPRRVPVTSGPKLEAYYPNGQREFLGAQVEVEPGLWSREGAWTAWHENGVIDEQGAYLGDVEDGPWQWWYANGNLKAVGTWVEGKRVGEWRFWHESGGLGTVGHYLDGEGHGPWTLYHENGLKWAEGPYSHGEISGFWTVWNEDGSVNEERTGTYAGGEKAQ
jgi:hypothetical protein